MLITTSFLFLPQLYRLFFDTKVNFNCFECPVGFAPMNGHIFFQPAGATHYFKNIQMLELGGINPNPVFFCFIFVSYTTDLFCVKVTE